MNRLALRVPTYTGNTLPPAGQDYPPDYSEPQVPLLAYEAEGLRIVLGSHDENDYNVPDVQIERRPQGWAIFLHPVGGMDAAGYLYFLDDGRSFLVRENSFPGGSPPPIEIVEDAKDIPELDRIPQETV